MNWKDRDWTFEDLQFSPKRKVNNRNSQHHPHIIGSFYSQKMKCIIDYESLNERLFYYYLEIEQTVIRYYVQPLEVTIKDKSGDTWIHVPDVLVFRQELPPLLYQIKDSEHQSDEKFKLVNEYCEEYALNHKFLYSIIFPKDLPANILINIRFLKSFIKERKYYKAWRDSVINRLKCLESCTIEELSHQFSHEFHPLLLKPLIFHLVALGIFSVDFMKKIDSNSIVFLEKNSKNKVGIRLIKT